MRKIWSVPTMCAAVRGRPVNVIVAVMLLSACDPMGGSETERTLCGELRTDLPSWSSADSEQSQAEGADFLDVFAAVCP